MHGSARTSIVVLVIGALLIGAVALWAYNQPRQKPVSAGVVQASPQDLARAAASGLPYVVKIGSDSCIPCRQMNPVMESLALMVRGKVGVYNLDVYKHQSYAYDLGVRVIPTVLFFLPGGTIAHRHEGAMSEPSMVSVMKSLSMID